MRRLEKIPSDRPCSTGPKPIREGDHFGEVKKKEGGKKKQQK